jgi:hypothetical protein
MIILSLFVVGMGLQATTLPFLRMGSTKPMGIPGQQPTTVPISGRKDYEKQPVTRRYSQDGLTDCRRKGLRVNSVNCKSDALQKALDMTSWRLTRERPQT